MRALLALLVLGLLAGCSTPETSPAATPASSLTEPIFGAGEAEPVPAEPGIPYAFRTSIGDGGFEHARLDAATQATIVWKNDGTQTHSVVSDDGTFAGSGPIAPGSEFSYTFQTPGDFAYHCRYHPDMKGLLVVR